MLFFCITRKKIY